MADSAEHQGIGLLPKVGIIVVAVAGIALAAVMLWRQMPRDASQGRVSLTCESCGREFTAGWDEKPVCPGCGQAGGIVRTRYRCPACGHTFVGTETKVMGPRDCRWRVMGATKWAGFPPRQLICPKCRRVFGDIDKAIVREAPKAAGP